MAIAAGNLECVLEERQPDGSTWRGPGRIVDVPTATSALGGAGTVKQCVRVAGAGR